MSCPHPAIVAWETGRRRWVVALSLLGVALFAASFFLPWWEFRLYAPQYSDGLKMVISLTGVTGDVHEVNTINHYIGMGHMDEAAVWERRFAGWLIGGLGLGVVSAVLLAGRKIGWLAAAIAASFPLGFLADTFYWMYHFGHELDPKAPFHMAPFTPSLFGMGKVGQFTTWAGPSWGFWLALTAVGLLGVAIYQRAKVCRICPLHDSCGMTCSRQLLRVPE